MENSIRFTPMQVAMLTAMLLLAFAASLGMPYNVDAIARSFAATNFQVGVVTSTEMVAIAVGNLLFARLAARLNPHRVYLFGILAIVGLNTASLFATGLVDLALMRVPAGFALGAVVSTVMATAARSASPEMTFGIINSMVGVMGMALAYVLPRALGAHVLANEHLAFGSTVWNELDGLFAVYVLCSLGALLFIRYTPSQAPIAASHRGAAPKGAGWLALLGLGLIFHGHGVLGMFLFRIGRDVPLATETVGYVLMAGALVTIGLPLLSGYIGSRFKPLLPLLIMTLLMTIFGLALSNIEDSLAYILATPLFAALPIAYMPIMMGVLARLDPSGTLVGSHPAFVLIGGALAPLVGGMVSDAANGFAANGWVAAALFWVGLGFCARVLMQVQREPMPQASG